MKTACVGILSIIEYLRYVHAIFLEMLHFTTFQNTTYHM